MKAHEIKGTQAWVDKLCKHEMPALAATVKSLEKLADDNKASLPELGKAVLHDQGLTTRILKVVNSVTYSAGRNKVTTVSRAAVILGYDTLKHICITAKMFDSMLRNRDISKLVHERLLRLMAKSFHSAMVARMLIGDRAKDTQEEVYIAALLHELGEIAFWSTGGKITEELDSELRKTSGNKNDLVRNILGTSFDQLSIGLASAWNLSDMVICAIETPGLRTPEMRAIGLASDYSDALTQTHSDVNLSRCLQDISELINTPVQGVKQKLKLCTEHAVQLAVSYGGHALTEFLDPNANLSKIHLEDAQFKPNESMQLKVLRDLTHIAQDNADLNLLVNTTIEGLHRGVGMERVIVFMLTQAKTRMKPRFVSCKDAEHIETSFVFPLTDGDIVFDHVFRTQQPVWVDSPSAEKWRKRLTPAIRSLSLGVPFFVGPLRVNKKCLGLIYADRAESQSMLKNEDFAAFNHFTGQLSLCLSHRFNG